MMLAPAAPSVGQYGKVKAKLKPVPFDFRSRRFAVTLITPSTATLEDDESPLKDAIRAWLDSK